MVWDFLFQYALVKNNWSKKWSRTLGLAWLTFAVASLSISATTLDKTQANVRQNYCSNLGFSISCTLKVPTSQLSNNESTTRNISDQLFGGRSIACAAGPWEGLKNLGVGGTVC